MELVKSRWVVGETAGGSRNDLEKFATNPQYVISLKEPGEKPIIFTLFLNKANLCYISF